MDNIDNSLEKEFNFEQRLNALSKELRTPEEWQKFIDSYHEDFCSIIARLETKAYKDNNDSSKKPVAIITGGQPGSGKSVLLPTCSILLNNKYGINALVNNADFYRFCVPGSHLIARDFPEQASKITDPVVKTMRKKLISESIVQNQSIIIENTLGDTLAVDQILNAGKHDVWLAIMAVPREESLLSDFERYIKMKENFETARLVSVEEHDKRYFALNKNVDRFDKNGIRVLVYSRGKTPNDFANMEYDSFDKSNNRYSCANETINMLRTKSLNESIIGYDERIKTIRDKMEGFGMTRAERKELEHLESIINQTINRKNAEIQK